MQGIEARKKQREQYLRALANKRTEAAPSGQQPPVHQAAFSQQQQQQQQRGVREEIYEQRRQAFQQRAAGPAQSPQHSHHAPLAFEAQERAPYYPTTQELMTTQSAQGFSPQHSPSQRHFQQQQLQLQSPNLEAPQHYQQQQLHSPPPHEMRQQQQQYAPVPSGGGLVIPGLTIDPKVAKEMKRQQQAELAQALQQQINHSNHQRTADIPRQSQQPVHQAAAQQQQGGFGSANHIGIGAATAQGFQIGETAIPRQGHRLGGGISALHAGDGDAKRVAKQQYAMQLQEQIRQKQDATRAQPQQQSVQEPHITNQQPQYVLSMQQMQPQQHAMQAQPPVMNQTPFYANGPAGFASSSQAISSPTRVPQQQAGEFVIGPLGLPVRKTYEIGNRAMQQAAHQPTQEAVVAGPPATEHHQYPAMQSSQPAPQSNQINHPGYGQAANLPHPNTAINHSAQSPTHPLARGRQLAALRGGLTSEQEDRAARAKAEQAAFLAQQIAEKEERKKAEKIRAAQQEIEDQKRIERELAIEAERRNQEMERVRPKQPAFPANQQGPPVTPVAAQDSRTNFPQTPAMPQHQQRQDQYPQQRHQQPNHRGQQPQLSIETNDDPVRPAKPESPLQSQRKGTQGLWGQVSPQRQSHVSHNQYQAQPSPPVPAQRHKLAALWDDHPSVSEVQAQPQYPVHADMSSLIQQRQQQQQQQPATPRRHAATDVNPANQRLQQSGAEIRHLQTTLDDPHALVAKLQQEAESTRLQLEAFKAQLQAQQRQISNSDRDDDVQSITSSHTGSRCNSHPRQPDIDFNARRAPQQQVAANVAQRDTASRQSDRHNSDMWARPVVQARPPNTQPDGQLAHFQTHLPVNDNGQRRDANIFDEDEVFRVDTTLDGSSRFVFPDGRSFVGDRSKGHSQQPPPQQATASHPSGQSSNKSAQMMQSLRNIGALGDRPQAADYNQEFNLSPRVSTPAPSECTDNFDLGKYYDRNQQRWALMSGMDVPDSAELQQLRHLQTRGWDDGESLYSARPTSRSSMQSTGRPASGRLMSGGRNVMTSHSHASLHSVNYSDTFSESNFGY